MVKITKVCARCTRPARELHLALDVRVGRVPVCADCAIDAWQERKAVIAMARAAQQRAGQERIPGM